MTDITVIILIGQEKIHLKRCVEKFAPLNPRQIFLVESQPDDGGVAIAKETAAKLGRHRRVVESSYANVHKLKRIGLTSFLYFMDGMKGRSSRRTSSRGRLSAAIRRR